MLPPDIINIIKEFCFYDVKTWEIIRNIKHNKTLVNFYINTAISRYNPYNFFNNDGDDGGGDGLANDEDEHWIFWPFSDIVGVKYQLQAFNCRFCGNYKFMRRANDDVDDNGGIYPDKIYCFC
jgi:hypothetical protein